MAYGVVYSLEKGILECGTAPRLLEVFPACGNQLTQRILFINGDELVSKSVICSVE